MKRSKEDNEMLAWLFGFGERFDRIEWRLDLTLARLNGLRRRGDRMMVDLADLKAAWQDVKDDIADAVARLKDLGDRVEDPAVKAEIDSIAADMHAVDKSYDDAVAATVNPEPVTSVTGDKLEPVYPADDGQPVEGTVPEAPDSTS